MPAKKPTKASKKVTKKKVTKKKTTRKKRGPSLKQNPRCTLTQKIIDDFAAIVEKGNFRTTARQRLGISVFVYDRWIQAGHKQIRDHETGKRPNILLQGKLVKALDAAEGYVHGKMIEDILDSGSIQARQWYLEKRFNKLYSKNPNAHLDDESGQTITTDINEVLAEKLATLLGKK